MAMQRSRQKKPQQHDRPHRRKAFLDFLFETSAPEDFAQVTTFSTFRDMDTDMVPSVSKFAPGFHCTAFALTRTRPFT